CSGEGSPLGTAGSVRHAAKQLDETFLVISGDALRDGELSKLVAFHKEREAAVTKGLKAVDNPLEFGIVVTDEEGRVERFLEKPSWSQVFSDTINTGIYVLEPEVLRHVPTDRPYDFSKELFPYLLDMGRPIYGYAMDGYWQDIGNLDQFRQANFDALGEKVRLNISGIRIRGHVWLGEGVEVGDLDQVEGPAYVGNYCRIAPSASVGAHTVLSNSVTLRERTRIVRSVVDASTHVGRSARHRAAAQRTCGGGPRVAAGVPDDETRADLRLHVDGSRRRRPARAACRRRAPPAEERELRRRRARRHESGRSRGRPDPLLRAARDPDDELAAEGSGEELHARRAAARRVRCGRLRELSGARARDVRPGSPRRPRRRRY